MYEIVNWIIFGLSTTVLIAYSAYTLNCLLKTETNFLVIQLVLFFAMNTLSLGVFKLMLTQVKSGQLSLITLLGAFIVDLVVLLLVIATYHDCIVLDYKWQKEQIKDNLENKVIKL